MSTATDITTTIQEQVLGTLETGQQLVLDGLRTTRETLGGILPESIRPDKVKLPFADRLPTPEEAVETSFTFLEKLVASQHDFAKKVVSTTTSGPGSEAGTSLRSGKSKSAS